mgnify:CR=1 FL=1
MLVYEHKNEQERNPIEAQMRLRLTASRYLSKNETIISVLQVENALQGSIQPYYSN